MFGSRYVPPPAPAYPDALYVAGGKCGDVPYFDTETDSPMEVLMLLGRFIVAWCIVWLACGLFAKAVLMPRIPASTKPRENSAFYVGQKLAAEIKVVLVAGIANVAIYKLWTYEPWSRDVEFGGYPLIEVAGVLFTSFETADLILCVAFGFLDKEHIIHHIIHIALGLLIRINCAPALTASILTAQETSGFFLNYYLLMRYRNPKGVLKAQALFALSFFVWRLLIGPAGTIHYLTYSADHLPTAFPSGAAQLLGGALVLASVLQFYWGWAIIKMVLRKLGIGVKKVKDEELEEAALKVQTALRASAVRKEASVAARRNSHSWTEGAWTGDL